MQLQDRLRLTEFILVLQYIIFKGTLNLKCIHFDKHCSSNQFSEIKVSSGAITKQDVELILWVTVPTGTNF
jgi:hypothetical protein